MEKCRIFYLKFLLKNRVVWIKSYYKVGVQSILYLKRRLIL